MKYLKNIKTKWRIKHGRCWFCGDVAFRNLECKKCHESLPRLMEKALVNNKKES